MRLIDADALYKAMQNAEDLARRRVLDTESTLPYPTNLNPAYTRYLAQMDERTKAKEMVADAPTVDAVPVVHGRWKAVTDDGNEYKRICSCCGEEAPYDNGDEGPLSEGYYLLYPHCPWCGARMDGKGGDGNG